MKKILLITTGGTIASKNSSEGLTPAMSSEELLTYVPEVKELCDVETIQILNIDSTNIQPEYWLLMVNTIKENYHKYDGFVMTHGTDTMAYTSAALSYLMQNLGKPLIITGSQQPMQDVVTDAKKNLIDSFRFAVEENVKGIFIVFDGKAIIGTRARKYRTKSYSAFESVNFPYAAYIDNYKITRFTKPENINEEFKCYDEIYPSIFVLKLVPGMEPDVLDYIGEKYEGIVIESYGVGGIPFNDKRDFLSKLGSLTKQGKIVVITTQVALEGSDMGIYEVGLKALNNYSVLQAYDMTVEAAVTKLMWILARTKKFDEVKELFYTKINNDILVF